MTLKDRLPGSEPSDAVVERVWQGVNEKSERRVWPFVMAFAASAAAIVLFVMTRSGPCDSALCTESGQLMQAAVSGDAIDSERVIALRDRSSIRMTPRTVARVAANSPSAVDIELSTGKVVVHVEPKGPRRWGITAGDVRVEVVGTTFSVERGPNGVRVEVSEGTVQVSGPGVPGGFRRVPAGETFSGVIETPVETPKPSPLETPPPKPIVKPARPVSSPLVGQSPTPPVGRASAPADWRTPAREGRFADAVIVLGRDFEKEADGANAADVILLADVAAHAGDGAASERLLARVATMQASGEERAIAEYKRGQRLLARGEAERAAEAFERAIASGLPAPLQESARSLVIEAKRRK